MAGYFVVCLVFGYVLCSFLRHVRQLSGAMGMPCGTVIGRCSAAFESLGQAR